MPGETGNRPVREFGKHIVITKASWQELENMRMAKTQRLGRLVTMAEAVEDVLARLDELAGKESA